MKNSATAGRQVPQSLAVLTLCLWLTACGGGGSDTQEPPKATPLPDLNIAVPATGDAAQPVAFSTSVALGAGLKASWDFGDGSSSTESAPKHAYAKAGDYEVRLTLSNEAGQTRQYKQSFLLNRPAVTKGLQCAKADETGWCWQQPLPTGNAISWSSMVDDKAGWRIGDGGVIYRTLDGGKTWNRRRAPTDVLLHGVYPVSADEVWVLGAASTLLHTTDGGASWKITSTPVDFTDSSGNFWLQQDGGLAIRDSSGGTVAAYFSADAGASWQPRSVADVSGPRQFDSKGRLWAVKNDTLVVLDLKTGAATTATTFDRLKDLSGWPTYADLTLVTEGDVIALVQNGQYFDGDAVWRHQGAVTLSADGGKTWKTQKFSMSPPPGYFTLLAVDPTGTRLVAQFGSAPVYSLDGGATWKNGSLPTDFNGNISPGCVTVGASRLMCLAGYGQGMAVTADWGATWTFMNRPAGFASIYSQLRLRGLRNGDVQLQARGGETYLYSVSADAWKEVAPASKASLRSSVSFADAKNGVMVQADNRVYRTVDGGLTWFPASLPGNLKTGDLLPLLSRAGDRVAVLTNGGELLLSLDAGLSWSSMATPSLPIGSYGLARLVFQDDKFQWAVPKDSGQRRIYVSTDGALNWRAVPVPLELVGAVYRHASGRLTVTGNRGLVLQSDDDGATWYYRYTGATALISALHTLDGQRMWAVGAEGSVILSTDGGVTWTKLRLGYTQQLNDVRFADADHGWIVGEGGLILATVDGGKTWLPQIGVTAQNLLHIEAVDARTAWITGDNGAVLATGTGGY
ncbi:MAG TPA: YCF48-related protein [Burkholderiaceae bacterium]|nr:YCF48-related protein [Burkholderiaceae bacterium]